MPELNFTLNYRYKKDSNLTNDNEVACHISDLPNFYKQITANSYNNLQNNKSPFASSSCNNHLKNKISLITVEETHLYYSNYERYVPFYTA